MESGDYYADVISFSNNTSASFFHSDFLYPMNSLEGAITLLSNMQPPTMPIVLVDTTIYGMPYGFEAGAMVYNKDLFDDASLAYPSSSEPMTWDEFKTMCSRLTIKDNSENITQYAAHFHKTEIWEAFVVQAGGNLTDNDTCPTHMLINSPEGIKGLQFMRDLIDSDFIPPYTGSAGEWNGQWGSPDNAISTGKVAIIQTLPFSLDAIKDAGIRYGTAPLPKDEKRATKGYINFASIWKDSANIKEAWTFVQWLCGIGQIEFASSGGLPANKDYLDYAKVVLNNKYSEEIMSAFYSELPYLIPGPMIPGYPGYANNAFLSNIVDDFLYGNIDAATCAQRMEEDGNRIIGGLPPIY